MSVFFLNYVCIWNPFSDLEKSEMIFILILACLLKRHDDVLSFLLWSSKVDLPSNVIPKAVKTKPALSYVEYGASTEGLGRGQKEGLRSIR